MVLLSINSSTLVGLFWRPIFALILLTPVCYAQDLTIAEQLREAASHIQNNRPNQAESILRKVVSAAPANADAHNLLGIALDQKGDFSGAEKQYRLSLRLRPTAASPQANLAALLAKTNRTAEAITAFETVLSIRPDHPQATVNLGFLYNSIGRFDKAASFLAKANRLQPNDFDVNINLGTAHYQLRQFEQARSSLQTAASIKPEKVEPIYWLGMIAFALGNHESAGEYFERAISLKPDHSPANFMLGELFAKRKKYIEAKVFYARALAIDRTQSVHFIRLGGIYIYLSDFDGALPIFKEGSEAFPKIPEMHYFLALALRGTGQFDMALARVRHAITLRPTYADGYALQGAIQIDKNDLVGASRSLVLAIKYNSDHFNAHRDLGRLLVKQQNFAQALPILQRAAILSPGVDDIHYQLFVAYSRLKRKSEAEKEMQIFRRLSGQNKN